jgi:hypothetical protein
MGPSVPTTGLLALLLMAFSCFPTAREKSKALTAKEGEFQCVSCGIRKRRTTVIAGSGIVGLSTAYWNGRMNKSKQHKTIVLEARNQYFQGASGHNSGLLSCHWFSGGLRQLADHSFGIYQDLARKQTDFKSASDYHENALFQAHCGEGPTDPRAPHWIKVAEGWHLESEPATRFVRQDKTRDSSILQDNPSNATMYVLTQVFPAVAQLKFLFLAIRKAWGSGFTTGVSSMEFALRPTALYSKCTCATVESFVLCW